MHDRIFKYDLNLVSKQHMSIPKGGNILCVQVEREKLCLFAVVDTKEKNEVRTLEVIGTGQAFRPLNPDERRDHLDTVIHSGMVWHIFEIVNK